MLAMLGETLTQRAGIINLGVEGEMLVGACVGFAVAAISGSAALGLGAGAGAGLLLSMLHAGLVLGARANQIGSGIAVWMIGLGGTSYFGRTFVGRRVGGMGPLGGAAEGHGFLQSALAQLTPAAPFALGVALLAGVWLFRTRPGLAWRTTGESASVARALGLRPRRIRFRAILAGGLLAGLGGSVLSVDYTQTWAQDITKGAGLVAVGLVVVARWNPYLVIPVALLFGLAQASTLRLQAGGFAISPSLLAATPYLLSIAAIVVAQLRARRHSAMPADLRAIFRTR
jgi:simple sugar transport system permease protein